MPIQYEPRLTIHYRPEMSPPQVGSFSMSPTKPRRFMEFLRGTPVWPYVEVFDNFTAVGSAQLVTAHTKEYVHSFMTGAGYLASTNCIDWSPDVRDSVLMTNGSLLSAIRGAHASPTRIHMSPSSGFHHATPWGGEGFCTFSGQVIAALAMWRYGGSRGAWIDLDGHFGNSIEDSRAFAPDLDDAIPPDCNINPSGSHGAYLASLGTRLARLGERVIHGEINYVCFAHGADSHEWDALGHQCSTDEWLAASDLVYSSIRSWSRRIGRQVPIVLALFGGYRDDHPESVLGLHAMDAARALVELGGVTGLNDWRAEVRPR